MDYLFYIVDCDQPCEAAPKPAADWLIQLWRPSWRHITPPGVSCFHYTVYWCMHQLRFFRNRDYAVLLVSQAGKLVHHSCVNPPDLRYPFMAKNDLQIGDVWTDPSARASGLATFAVAHITRLLCVRGRRFWYVTAADNLASVRTATKAGFRIEGRGRRERRLGIVPVYQLTEAVAHNSKANTSGNLADAAPQSSGKER